jgi:hypothetical protein
MPHEAMVTLSFLFPRGDAIKAELERAPGHGHGNGTG